MLSVQLLSGARFLAECGFETDHIDCSAVLILPILAQAGKICDLRITAMATPAISTVIYSNKDIRFIRFIL
jgi:hypothetical protein